jgi:hypothetical protein
MTDCFYFLDKVWGKVFSWVGIKVWGSEDSKEGI